jgi:protein phosphatase
MKKYKYIWTVKSECGPVRKKNEDSVFPLESGSSEFSIKAGVFDGMGGHKKGEVASNLAYKTMYENFNNLSDYVNAANKNILDYQASDNDAKGMGTTMTIVEISQDGTLSLAHVGDSRCYVLSSRKLLQITEDENVPGYQNVLTQALGSKEKLKIQKKDFQLSSGDVVFLCTDGIYNEVGDEYLKKKLLDGINAESLVGEVLLQNPKDNISAIIINVI